jgi:iron transport multicopper oxidase
MCLGSPVALPLQCSQPVNFGSVAIGTAATQIVNCTAHIPITSINGCTTGDATFKCLNSTLPTGPLVQGATFSFPVTWNLTQSSINDAQNASFGKVLPGVKSTSLNIYTTNGVPKYSPQLPVSLQGVTASKDAFLSISPPELDFGGLVVGTGGTPQTSSLNVIISNLGSQALNFTGLAWTESLDNNTVSWNNITSNGNGTYITGTAFTSPLLPQIGDTVAPGSSITVPLSFTTNSVGTFQSALEFWTTGGNAYALLVGSGSTAPIANISVSTVEGGWDYSEPVVMNFGNVLAGTTQVMTLRICNSGGSALEVTKSKPPIQSELTAANPSTDLHEGQFIDVNTCASAEMDIIAAPLGVNHPPHTVSDVWILNTNDLTFGVHDVSVTANMVTRQVGPLMPDGTARFLYLGCYSDQTRQLQKNYNNNTGNENGWCQANCLANGYMFAGTEYRKLRFSCVRCAVR